MLPTENRLTKMRDFNLLMAKGKWYKGGFFIAKVLDLAKNSTFFPKKEDKNKFEKQLKIAVSAGLKYSKSAVERNRARRQVSEAVRSLLQDKKIKTGFYILLVPEVSMKEKEYAVISQEVTLLLKKMGVLV